MTELQALKARLEALEREVATLKRTVPRTGTVNTKPINMIAYDAAIDAMIQGDQRPLNEYRKLYSIPT